MALDNSVQEVQRIETLLTEFQPGSDTGRINAQAGIAAQHKQRNTATD